MKQTTDPQLDLIIRLLRAANSVTSVARQLAISKQRIYQKLRAAGVPADFGAKRRADREEQILALHKAGKNNTEIAAVIKANDRTIRDVLSAYGLKARGYHPDTPPTKVCVTCGLEKDRKTEYWSRGGNCVQASCIECLTKPKADKPTPADNLRL